MWDEMKHGKSPYRKRKPNLKVTTDPNLTVGEQEYLYNELMEMEKTVALMEQIKEQQALLAMPLPLSEVATLPLDKQLDIYNDYIALGEMFGDEAYTHFAELIMGIIKGGNRNKAS